MICWFRLLPLVVRSAKICLKSLAEPYNLIHVMLRNGSAESQPIARSPQDQNVSPFQSLGQRKNTTNSGYNISTSQ